MALDISRRQHARGNPAGCACDECPFESLYSRACQELGGRISGVTENQDGSVTAHLCCGSEEVTYFQSGRRLIQHLALRARVQLILGRRPLTTRHHSKRRISPHHDPENTSAHRG